MPEITQTHEYLTANLSGKVRRDLLNGREHLVAPVSLIKPGVLNGSQGPLLYTDEEVGKDPTIWNHMPIVENHPYDGDKPVSARSAKILNERQLGVVLGSTYNGKLTAEGWFDIEKTRQVNPQLLNRIEKGDPIELSTGLFTDNEPQTGMTENGTEYTAVARNFRPDHLAILTSEKGACSVNDGCGVNVNQRTTTNPLERLGHKFLEALGLSEKDLPVKNQTDSQRPVSNALSQLEVGREVEQWLRKRFGEMALEDGEVKTMPDWVFDDHFIFWRAPGKMFKVEFSKTDDGVEFSDEPPMEVKEVRTFEPVENRTNNQSTEFQNPNYVVPREEVLNRIQAANTARNK